jgi:RNA polymerase sigma-70 factor (ECF subfamily)
VKPGARAPSISGLAPLRRGRRRISFASSIAADRPFFELERVPAMAGGERERKPNIIPLGAKRSSSLEALYRQHSGWLGKVLAARFRSTPLDIDDLVQDTYVRLSRYEAEDAERHPKALLMRIAVNLARDHMRKNVVRGGLAPVDEEELAKLPAPADQHHLLQLKQMVLDLPPIYRDVFVLSRFTGLTYEEIASHVGVSVKTVEWRMSKALAMILSRFRD